MIRPIQKSDISSIVKHCEKFFPNDLTDIKKELDHSIDNKSFNSSYFVLEDEKQIIGAVGLNQFAKCPNIGWLGWFFVSEEYQGRGHGADLIGHVLRLTEIKKLSAVFAWTTAREMKDFGTDRFYLRMGWQPVTCPETAMFKGERVSVFGKQVHDAACPDLPECSAWLF